MTTQVPYGPPGTTQPQPPHAPPQPPPSAYPTAPPWATPAANVPMPDAAHEPPATYGAASPYGSPYQEHGQLLVAFPEEMKNAGRPTPPSWWPIVPLTFLVLPGLVSAARRAKRARRGRNSRAPYWITFGAALVVFAYAWSLIVPAGQDVWQSFRERSYTTAVQQQIVKDGQLKTKSKVTATSAKCTATAPRGADDQRRYSCVLKLDDGRTGTVEVTADPKGHWTAVPPAKKKAVPPAKKK
jgi:hypothetical protein